MELTYTKSEVPLVRASFTGIKFEFFGEFMRFLQMNLLRPVVVSQEIHATLASDGSLEGAFRPDALNKIEKWLVDNNRIESS